MASWDFNKINSLTFSRLEAKPFDFVMYSLELVIKGEIILQIFVSPKMR